MLDGETPEARLKRLKKKSAKPDHPAHVAASLRFTVDELQVLANLRRAPLAVVKSVTNDVYVPADAEIVLEGYLDPRGHVEDEGPFGSSSATTGS